MLVRRYQRLKAQPLFFLMYKSGLNKFEANSVKTPTHYTGGCA